MQSKIEYGRAGERTEANAIEMPAPTMQPLLLAFGLLLAFAGYIFLPLLSYLGFGLALAAAAGWCMNVIPNEKHETVKVDAKHRPSGILAKPYAVAQLRVGDEQHRVHVPEETAPYTAGIWGGLAGAGVMAILACSYGVIAHGSIWFPVNLLAGVVMPNIGHEGLPQLVSFEPFAFGAALVGHLALSILVGVLYAVMLPMFPKYAPLWAGVLLPLVWTGLVATVLSLVNPALNDQISWPWYIACQIAFGMVCGYVVARSERITTLQSLPLSERAFLHAAGIGNKDRQK